MKNDREEKKRYLLRKLSFRPTVDELKNRKVSTPLIRQPPAAVLQALNVANLILSCLDY